MDRTDCTVPQCLYNGALYLYLYLYSPYGPHGLYRASVPVQRCTLPLPIPLLPLWTVRPVQCLSACTTVHFTFTYTSTPLMGRTACTEPQCLYNGALYLYLHLYSPYGPYDLYRASVPVQRRTLPYLLRSGQDIRENTIGRSRGWGALLVRKPRRLSQGLLSTFYATAVYSSNLKQFLSVSHDKTWHTSFKRLLLNPYPQTVHTNLAASYRFRKQTETASLKYLKCN